MIVKSQCKKKIRNLRAFITDNEKEIKKNKNK